MLVVLVAATAGVVALAGGGSAFWVSIPVALLVSLTGRSRLAQIGGAAAVVAAAAGAGALRSGATLPPTWLAVIVPAASVAVALTMRGRLERERDRLRRTALTDPLTGIPNRRFLLERIDYEIARHRRQGHSFVLVMLDLDGFKALNDRYGHAAGDEMLREVAAALRHSLRAQDTAARIGGDEFCVLAPETAEPGVAQLADRIGAAVGDVTSGLDTLHATIGAAVFPDDGTTASALLRVADRRMLDDKLNVPDDARVRRGAARGGERRAA